jgi:large subunit ribosomal protein L22
MVRGQPVVQALDLLKFTPKVAARHVFKLLTSAVSNAEENFGLSRDNLIIYRITADEAPTRKWRRFGARGRFKPLLRRSSHVTIVLRERAA